MTHREPSQLRVAVLTTHEAVARMDNPDFSRFFAMLGAMAAVRSFGGDAEELADCDALLVGGPLRRFGAGMVAGISGAVERGCHLLILAHAGGDAAPLGVTGAASNLSQLCPGLELDDTALHLHSVMESYDNMLAELRAGEGHPGGWVVGACTVTVGPGVQLLRRIDVDARVGVGLRRDQEYGDEVVTAGRLEERRATVFVRARRGRGSVTMLTGAYSLSDAPDDKGFQAELCRFVLGEWLAEAELARRRRRAQRHRLLHGYPMQPLGALTDGYAPREAGRDRELVVGVLPHVFCNPTVEGCGFCVFPHEKLDQGSMAAVVGRVQADIDAHPRRGQPAAALYLGGATANLTPAPLLEALCRALARAFRPAEVTLEGVARYFQIDDHRSLAILREVFGDAALRISMGVQTFDAARLRLMGRSGFGDLEVFARVVARARAEGFSVSGDLLINLPGQEVAAMLRDAHTAIELGFDQICVYHLVLTPELDVPWGRDKKMLRALPANDDACASWLAVRELLLSRGFAQRTLTNFVRAGAPPFRYEERGFDPVACDTLGFGPSSITRIAAADFRSGLKVERPAATADYLGGRNQRRFEYSRRDMEILHLTRGLARLRVPGAEFASLFGRPLATAFASELDACLAAGLVELAADDALTLTPTGMFYADAVAGLMAATRVAELRAPRPPAPRTQRGLAGPHAVGWRKFRDPNDSTYGGMG